MKPLAIIGNGMTRENERHGDKSWEVWAMNNHPFLWQKPVTALFEMHPDVMETERYQPDYKEWLKQAHPFPIYMQQVHPDIPASVQYPFKEIQRKRKFIRKGTRYLHDFYTETTAYMLALAWYQGYTRIELHGIDLNKDHQYRRDSVFFWLGFLNANNIAITIPTASPLMFEERYPVKVGNAYTI
jgi:hypothetical protein